MLVLNRNNRGDSYIGLLLRIAVKHHDFGSLPDGLLNPPSVSQSAHATSTNIADFLSRIYSFNSKQA